MTPWWLHKTTNDEAEYCSCLGSNIQVDALPAPGGWSKETNLMTLTMANEYLCMVGCQPVQQQRHCACD